MRKQIVLFLGIYRMTLYDIVFLLGTNIILIGIHGYLVLKGWWLTVLEVLSTR